MSLRCARLHRRASATWSSCTCRTDCRLIPGGSSIHAIWFQSCRPISLLCSTTVKSTLLTLLIGRAAVSGGDVCQFGNSRKAASRNVELTPIVLSETPRVDWFPRRQARRAPVARKHAGRPARSTPSGFKRPHVLRKRLRATELRVEIVDLFEGEHGLVRPSI